MPYTLPITPRTDALIGYWLTPVLADILRRSLREPLTVAVGTLGARAGAAEGLDRFRASLPTLGVDAEIWHDADHADRLAALADGTLARLPARFERRRNLVCPCGRVQVPVDPARYLKQKTFVSVGGDVVCRACGAAAVPTDTDDLVLRFPVASVLGEGFDVFPAFYRSELEDLLGQVARDGACVSRVRATPFASGGSHLDVEFVWQHQLALMPGPVLRVVVTNHVLRQALMCLLLLRASGDLRPVGLVVAPYLRHPGRPGKWTLDALTDVGHDTETLRCLLAGSVRWRSKDCDLETSIAHVEHLRFRLFQRRVRETANSLGKGSASIAGVNRESILLGMKHVYNPGRFPYASLSGLI